MVRKMVMGMGEAMLNLEGGEEGLQVLTIVLTRVRDGGDLDEEDNGYHSSSEDEGVVAAEMAERGVGSRPGGGGRLHLEHTRAEGPP